METGFGCYLRKFDYLYHFLPMFYFNILNLLCVYFCITDSLTVFNDTLDFESHHDNFGIVHAANWLTFLQLSEFASKKLKL